MNKADILRDLVTQSINQFATISTQEWNAKPFDHKWSKKEILGHLTDSCANNSRRFIVTQYEQGQKIVYKQNEWVASQNYQNTHFRTIIELWQLSNMQLATVIEQIPVDKLNYTCITDEARTLEWLIDDYIAHAKHHLKQITG
jgi:DinB superfamily